MLRMKFLSQKLIAVSSAEVVLSLPEKPTSSTLIVKYTMWPLASPIYPCKLSPLLCEIETLCHYFYTPGEKYSNVKCAVCLLVAHQAGTIVFILLKLLADAGFKSLR